MHNFFVCIFPVSKHILFTEVYAVMVIIWMTSLIITNIDIMNSHYYMWFDCHPLAFLNLV
jgi:hypothetical protein